MSAPVPSSNNEDAQTDVHHDLRLDEKSLTNSSGRGAIDAAQPASNEKVPVIEDEYPDGGLRAWLVVLGTVCSTCATFGYTNAFGVFQAYYQETILADEKPSNIAWIGSIQFSLVFLPGIITGRMFDLGYFKLPFFGASVLLVVATFLIAECKEYWQFILCQGFAVGIACGTIFGPTIGVVGHWFKKKRGLANGFNALGSGIGGTIFPILAKNLIPKVGFPWTMRILGFVLMALLTVSNLTMRRRLPPTNHPGGLLNLKAFKAPEYGVYCFSAFFAFLGLYTVQIYIDLAAIRANIDPNFAFYFIAIVNGSSGFARLGAGYLADHIGGANCIIPMSILGAAMTYAWPFVLTKGGLIALSIFYGFSAGTYVSCFALPLYNLGPIQDVGRRIGMSMTIAALGALAGPPISGAVYDATGGFEAVGWYAGSVTLISVAMVILTRQLVLGWRTVWAKF